MPIYEYRCDGCNSVYEEIVRLSDANPPCPTCGDVNVSRLMSQTSFQLKGNGWYATDYGRSSSNNGNGKPKSLEKTDSGSDSKSESTESKGTDD